MFVNTLSVSTDPATELVATSSPDSHNKSPDFKSCWVRRHWTNFAMTNSKWFMPCGKLNAKKVLSGFFPFFPGQFVCFCVPVTFTFMYPGLVHREQCHFTNYTIFMIEDNILLMEVPSTRSSNMLWCFLRSVINLVLHHILKRPICKKSRQ